MIERRALELTPQSQREMQTAGTKRANASCRAGVRSSEEVESVVMLRDPRIISLHDKPMYPRRASAYRADAPGYGTPFIACISIVVFTLGFFWLYDIVVHRDVPFVPALTQPAAASNYTLRTQAEVPAPDMTAPAVTLANSDVAPSVPLTAKHEDIHEAPKAAELPRKKKIARSAPRIPPEAAQAFASGSMLDQRPVW